MKLAKYKSLLVGATLMLSAGNVWAEAEYTLTISSWAPPTHNINAKMWPQFTKMVEEAKEKKMMEVSKAY